MTDVPTTRWIDAATPDALAERLAADVAEVLLEGLRERGVATLAVPGGTTPAPFLRALARHSLEWDKVFLCCTDERWVPDDHARSNASMIAAALHHGDAAQARILGLYDPELDVVAGAEAWAPPAFEGPFDAVVLGVGADGHTASLFPHTRSFTEALQAQPDRWAWPVTDAPQPEARVTLTPARLSDTRWLGVLAHGEAKRHVLEEAIATGPIDSLPLRWFLHRIDVPARIYHAPDAP